MTIEKGRAWGTPWGGSDEVAVAVDDAGLAGAAAAALGRGDHLVITLSGPSGRLAGDVARTLGVAVERSPSERLAYTFDLGFVTCDGGDPVPFVAHVSARRRLWAGEFAVVMNCAWMGSWYLGPRAHPNDGLLDVTTGSLPLRQRILARRRARSGSHLPHPRLSTARAGSWEHRFPTPRSVRIDGRPSGRARLLRAWVVPDGFTLVV